MRVLLIALLLLCLYGAAFSFDMTKKRYQDAQAGLGDLDMMTPQKVKELLITFGQKELLADLFLRAKVDGRMLRKMNAMKLAAIGVPEDMMKEVLQLVKIFDHLEHEEHHMEVDAKMQVVWAFIFPPKAIFSRFGYSSSFLVSILLTLLGYVPGQAHALYYCFA